MLRTRRLMRLRQSCPRRKRLLLFRLLRSSQLRMVRTLISQSPSQLSTRPYPL
jgi:hypothetical protein